MPPRLGTPAPEAVGVLFLCQCEGQLFLVLIGWTGGMRPPSLKGTMARRRPLQTTHKKSDRIFLGQTLMGVAYCLHGASVGDCDLSVMINAHVEPLQV